MSVVIFQVRFELFKNRRVAEFHKFLGDLKLLPPDAIRFELQHQISSSPIILSVRNGRCPKKHSDAVGNAINDWGQATGTSAVCGTPLRAVLWQDGRVIDLGNLGGTSPNWGYDINNQGQVVGISELTGDTTFHAFLWQRGVMTDLGTLPGDFGSDGDGINSKGQVVGGSFDINGNERAYLWQNGVMTDLNTLIPPNSPLYLLEATGTINDRGQIAIGGTTPGIGDFSAINGGVSGSTALILTGYGTSGSATLTWPAAAGTPANAIVSSNNLSAPALVSTVAIGTAPLQVTSTTNVPNLNASLLLGNNWAAPGTIGGTTPGAGDFSANNCGVSGSVACIFTGYGTSGSATLTWPAAAGTPANAITSSNNISAPAFVSTIATGTAPFTVSSTTNVPNLNASTLNGNTFAAPGTIGGTTPGTGDFSTLNLSAAGTVGSVDTGTPTFTFAANKVSFNSGTPTSALFDLSIYRKIKNPFPLAFWSINLRGVGNLHLEWRLGS